MLYVGIATVVVGAIGAGVSYVGAQQAADAAEEAGKAQAQAAEQAARNTELENAEAIKRERVNKRRHLARLRANHSTSGVTMDDSSLDVFAETAGAMELGIQDASRAGAIDPQNTRSRGEMAAWEARSLARATRVQSYGTLLSDSSRVANTYAATI